METVLIRVQHIFVMFEQQIRVEQQVVEIKRVCLLQALLQLKIHARRDFRNGVGCLFLIVKRVDEFVFRLRDLAANRVHRIPFRVDFQVIHDIFDQGLRIAIIVNGEVLREADDLRVGSKDTHAHAVKRGNPHTARRRADKLPQALAHFRSRLVRKRDGKNLPRIHAAVFDHVGNTVRKHARFT